MSGRKDFLKPQLPFPYISLGRMLDSATNRSRRMRLWVVGKELAVCVASSLEIISKNRF
jgi:hypothetical protein